MVNRHVSSQFQSGWKKGVQSPTRLSYEKVQSFGTRKQELFYLRTVVLLSTAQGSRERRQGSQGSSTSFGAGPQQVDDVEVRSQVAHDLQLGHEGLLLTTAGCGCWGKPV